MTQLVIGNAGTTGSFVLEGIPAGVRYILTATAVDSQGQTVTLKALLPELTANSQISIEINKLTTILVEALELIIQNRGTTIKELPQEIINAVRTDIGNDSNADPAVIASKYYGYTVSGRVTDGTNGIAGATISFSGSNGSVTTDASGNWSKTGLSGTVTVTPSKTGYDFAPVSTQVDAASSSVNFTGTAQVVTYTVSGRVTDGTNGIAGATISFSGSNGSVTTDANGNWSKTGLSGTVTVTPSKTGYDFSPVSTQVSAASSSVNFTGTAQVVTYTVSGHVTDGTNGLAGVTISLSGSFGSVTTDASGNWSKTGLSGTVAVTPSKTGYDFSPVSTQVSAASSSVNFTGTAQVMTYTVSGHVTDGTNGLTGVTISFSGSNGSVTTDANGNWSKTGLSGTVTVTPSKTGYDFSPVSTQVSAASSSVNFTGTAQVVTYTVSGHVTDGTNGLTGVTISFSGSNGIVTTDANGNWSKTGLSGTVTVTPSKTGYDFSPVFTQVSTASSNVNFTGTEQVVTYTVSGHVTDGTNGLTGVTISLSGSFGSVTTDASGNWSKTGLSGTVTVTPSKTGYDFSPVCTQVSAASSSVNFTGTAQVVTYTVSGHVTDGTNGLTGVTISFSGSFGSVTTDASGNWSKTGLSGTVTVTPSKTGYDFTPVSTQVSAASSNVNFTGAVQSYDISGRVTNGSVGIAGVQIALDGGFSPTLTDANGYWSKSDLHGTVNVTASKNGWSFTDKQVNAAASNVDFSGTFQVSGKVTNNSGQGIAGVTINFTNGYSSVTTDANGNWSKSGLAGSVDITAVKTGLSFNPAVWTADNPSTGLDFNAITYGASGRITDVSTGSGISGVTVNFSDGSSVTTDSNGNWSKSGLSGNFTVTPTKLAYSFAPASAQISSVSRTANFTGTALPTYTVSGRVTDGVNGIAGVSINFSGFAPVLTDANGNWSKSGLYGIVTVTALKSNYSFLPASIQVNAASSNVNFTGGALNYTVSGRVMDANSSGVSGVTINFSGSFSSVTTDANGNWSKNGLSGPVTVTPASDGWVYTPATRTVSASASNVNFSRTGQFSVSGRVTDMATGVGVQGVVIDGLTRHNNGYLETFSVNTDTNGDWSAVTESAAISVKPGVGYLANPSQFSVTGPRSDLNAVRYHIYTVSGRVVDGAGNGMPNVTVSFSGGFISTVTDANGNWAKSSLSGSIDITVSKTDLTFAPQTRTVTTDATGVDFTLATFTAHGYVVDLDDQPIAGVLIQFSDGNSTTTDQFGYWQKSGLSGTWVTVIPTKAGWHFQMRYSGTDDQVSYGWTEASFKGSYTVSGRVVDFQGNPYHYGTVQVLGYPGLGQAHPDENGNWNFSGLSGTYTMVFIPDDSGLISNGVGVSGPADNIQLVVNNKHNVNIVVVGNGTVQSEALHGAVDWVTAQADPGWRFDHWELYWGSDYMSNFTNNPQSFDVPELSLEITIKAVFVQVSD